MSARVSGEDLELAATWLEAYDSTAGDDTNGEVFARVAVWLRAESDRRIEESVIRHVEKTRRDEGLPQMPRARLREIIRRNRPGRGES